jgi:hypothetical protein
MLRKRVWDYMTDEELSPWMYANHEYGLIVGMKRVIRYGEFIRRVSGKAEAKISFQNLLEDLHKAKVPRDDINRIADLLQAFNGTYRPATIDQQRMAPYIGFARALLNMSVMGAAPIKNAAELASPLFRFGRPNYLLTLKDYLFGGGKLAYAGVNSAVEALGGSMKALGLTESEVLQLMRDTGVTAHGYMLTASASRDSGESRLGYAGNWLMDRFYRLNTLEYLDRVQQGLALGTAAGFFRRALQHSDRAIDRRFLEEVGLDKKDFEAVRAGAIEGRWTPDSRRKWELMLIQANRQTIPHPSTAERPLAAATGNPYVQVLYNLRGFMDATADLVARRIGRELKKGNPGPLIGGAIAFTAAVMMREWWNSVRGVEPDDDEKWWQRVLRWASMGGTAGSYTDVADVITSMKYGRDLNDYALGAFYGVAARAGGDIVGEPALSLYNDPTEIKEAASAATRGILKNTPFLRDFPNAVQWSEELLGVERQTVVRN